MTARIVLYMILASTLSFGGFVDSLFSDEKPQTPDKVLIVKSERKLYLLKDGKEIASYHIALGKEPIGKKTREGDMKTPEGNYTLDYKKKNSSFFRAIHISYPAKRDRLNALKNGVPPGGAIMIHGQPNGWGWASIILQRFDWTEGCVALSDGDMEEIWESVKVGTPVEIRK